MILIWHDIMSLLLLPLEFCTCTFSHAKFLIYTFKVKLAKKGGGCHIVGHLYKKVVKSQNHK